MGSKRTISDDNPGDLGECSTFTVGGFYGGSRQKHISNWMKEKLDRVAKASKLMEEKSLPSNYNPGVLGPPSTWQVFQRQVEAIKYSQIQGQGVIVFSYESDALGGSGKRNFVVAHPRLMYRRLLERNPQQRCSYEVIQEHAVSKLYFDLEFSCLHNQGKDGNAMVSTFIKIVCYFLHKEFGINCSKQNIMDLNSCSFLKFSRHLIFNLPGVAFATNIHVGNFVLMICRKIKEWNSGSPIEIPDITVENIRNLFVLDSKKNMILFCDEGVYTKNRNFRVLHSTKRGKNTPLVIANENQYTPVQKNGVSLEEQFFLDSLVTTVDETFRVLTYGESTTKVEKHTTNTDSFHTLSGNDCFTSSPYPEIDNHILGIVRPGYIRCWFYFSQSERLVYEIAQNRYCYNISREHRSNSVMYVVNLKMGIFYQKCHDPDCRDFRSDSWQLPESTIFWKNLGDDGLMELATSAGDFDDNEDENLIAALTQAEIEDEELRTLADNFEMWENVDLLSSQSSSFPGSQRSHSFSQNSNPWDKLSQLSTPDSSYFANFSDMTMSIDELSQQRDDLIHRENSNGIGVRGVSMSNSQWPSIIESDGDEELAREAAKVEQEILSTDSNTHNSEVQFNSYEL